ncbi:MAG: hypothetical protein ABL923_05265 [Burkholderiaceae bacterium]
MKIHSAHLRISLQFGLCLAAFLPLPSHAGLEVPYWLYPEWIAAKVMNFHSKNSERIEIAQAQAKDKNSSATSQNSNSTANGAIPIATSTEQPLRKTNLAPVETATPKVNEKHLSKDELMELRKQLRQK